MLNSSAGASIAVGVLLAMSTQFPSSADVYARRICVVLCVVAVGVWRATRARGRQRGTEDGSHDGLARTASLVATVSGILVGALLVVGGIDELAARSPWFPSDRGPVLQNPAIAGLIDAVALATAGMIAAALSRDRHAVAMQFGLLVLVGVWAGLVVAPRFGAADVHGTAAVLGLILAIVVAGFTVVQEVTYRRRRKRAWPDRLDHLTQSFPTWPGFRESAVMVLVAVLLLGSYASTSWATVVTSLVAMLTTYALLDRQWDSNLARLAVALTTLLIVSFSLAAFGPGSDRELTETLPVFFNLALFGFGYMTFHWHWLARVWDQQLLDGKAWTTSGRMIPIAHRAGFFCGVLGLLAAVQMSLWPVSMMAHSRDDSLGRWVTGLAGLVGLTAALTAAAMMTQKRTLVGLMILSIMAAGLFVGVRAGVLTGTSVW